MIINTFYNDNSIRSYQLQIKMQDRAILTRSEKIKELEARLTALVDAKFDSTSQKSIENITLAHELSKVKEKLLEVEQLSLGLRQSINPKKPDEILTIARLKDDVLSLRKEINDVENSIEESQKSFQASILREIKSSSQSNSLILAVLIPLVLNFLYTVWKDLKSGRNDRGS